MEPSAGAGTGAGPLLPAALSSTLLRLFNVPASVSGEGGEDYGELGTVGRSVVAGFRPRGDDKEEEDGGGVEPAVVGAGKGGASSAAARKQGRKKKK